jgi:thymidylate synthase ThyX
VRELLKGFTEFDSMPREFEAAQFTFEIILSAGAFGQLKRHRMMSIFKQPYDISLGVTVPPAITDTKQEKLFSGIMKQSEDAYKKLAKKHGRAAEYVLTNAHRRRVIASCDLRELYHVARLRMDSHAQWDIQDISRGMMEAAKKAAPITASLACGKDEYDKAYKEFIG